MLQQAFRSLRTKHPGYTLLAILTLALGIGANTAIFTIVNALLLRPLPYYNDPARLVLLSAPPADQPAARELMSWPHFTAIGERNRSFSSVAAATFEVFNLTAAQREPEQVPAARVSYQFFDTLGVPLALGRSFTKEEDQPGAPRAIIISHELWTRLFANDPAALGRTLTLDSADCTIVGILPANFTFPLIGARADIWAPRVFDLSLVTPARVTAGGAYFQVIGRLRPGVSRAAAQTELRAIYQQYRREFPGNYDATLDSAMTTLDLQAESVANLRPTLLILTGAVALVLLIACANVASLLLTRALGRRKEFALRAALGATRARLIVELATEGVLLALISGALGILLASTVLQLLPTFVAASTQEQQQLAHIDMDLRVLLFTLAVSLVSGIGFGLAPALQFSRVDLQSVLHEEGRATAGGRHKHRTRSLLVIAQVALAMVLLTGSGLLIRSFLNLRDVAPGFRPDHLLTLEMTLPSARYADSTQRVAFYRNVIDQIRQLPGVESAALSTALPAFPTHLTPALFEGQPEVPVGKRPTCNLQQITPEYSQSLGVPLVAGRGFNDHDDAQAPPVVIINQTARHRFWPTDTTVIGKHVWIGNLPKPFEVVGVFADTKNSGLATATSPEVFLPLPQLPWPLLNLSVRTHTSLDPHTLTAPVRRAIASVDPDQPITHIRTGDELLATANLQSRTILLLLGTLAGTALLLAVIGIYGLIAYSVAQRRKELGIRLALGATRPSILRLVFTSGLILTLTGIAVGTAASLATTKFLAAFLYGTTPTDPVTFAATAVLFLAIATTASLVPGVVATSIDPTDALRDD